VPVAARVAQEEQESLTAAKASTTSTAAAIEAPTAVIAVEAPTAEARWRRRPARPPAMLDGGIGRHAPALPPHRRSKRNRGGALAAEGASMAEGGHRGCRRCISAEGRAARGREGGAMEGWRSDQGEEGDGRRGGGWGVGERMR
jgi:hypothetical protein